MDVGTKAKDPSRGADFLAGRLRQTSGQLTPSNLVIYGKARLLRGGRQQSSFCISTRFVVQHWQKRCFKLSTIARSNWIQPESRPSGTTYATPISSCLITVICGDSATSVRWYVLHLCRVIIDTSCNRLLPCKIKRSFVVARQHIRTWLDGRAS